MDVGPRGAIAGGCLLLAALTAGCLPRGPLDLHPLSCLPKCYCGKTCEGDGCDSQSVHGAVTSNEGNGPGPNAAVIAPYSAYHPVPTHPAFTPWSLDDSPHDSGLLTTWSKGMNRMPRRATDSLYDQPPDETNIAREPTFTSPLGVPSSPASDGGGVTRASATAAGWHSAQ
jgi:hypothetical protein